MQSEDREMLELREVAEQQKGRSLVGPGSRLMECVYLTQARQWRMSLQGCSLQHSRVQVAVCPDEVIQRWGKQLGSPFVSL